MALALLTVVVVILEHQEQRIPEVVVVVDALIPETEKAVTEDWSWFV